jgi:hypothetical protein
VYTCSEPRSSRPDLVGKSRLPRLFPTTGSRTPLPPILCTLFQVPHPVSPAFATLTKTPGAWGAFFWSRDRDPLGTCSRNYPLFLQAVTQLSGTTGDSQPFTYQSVAHSFHRDGGCTPSSTFRLRRLQRADVSYAPKSFICNIYAPPRKCCKQKTYGTS